MLRPASDSGIHGYVPFLMVDDADVYHPSFGLIFEPMVRFHLTASVTICQLK
jgi:hypothetical protein